VPAQFVGQKLKTPAHVPVAIQRADSAIFTIDERLALMEKPRDIIKTGAEERGGDNFSNVRFGLFVVIDVKMPRIDVRVAMQVVFQMFPMADTHVLHQPGWIKL